MKFAIENGIIDLSYVQDKYEMSKREELLKKHKWAISQGKDGYWRTYLPDDEKGRKLVKKKNKGDLEALVVDFYKSLEDRPKTFEEAYKNWRLFKDNMVGDNSVYRYETDYKRFFLNTDFSKKEITHITEETVQTFMVSTIKRLGLKKKACKMLYGYIKNTLHSAVVNGYIEKNPVGFLEAKYFYKYCQNSEKPQHKKIVSNDEMTLLYGRFREDYQNNPTYIPTYAVHLATLTGMRVGELSALRWDSITNEYIIIDKSERYSRKTKEYYIDETKNGKERIFPITQDIKRLLDTVKMVEMKNGYISEWVFSNENGRIHAPIISSCIKNKCRQIGIDEKGIHAFRKTLNSKMRCSGVSATIAASLLGHTEEVNEKYYTFDVSSLKEKNDIVTKVTANF